MIGVTITEMYFPYDSIYYQFFLDFLKIFVTYSLKTGHQPFHCFSSVTDAYCFVLLGSENLIPKLWDIFGNSMENLKMPNHSTLIKDAEVSVFVNYNTWLAAIPLSIPSPGPTQLYPAKSRLNPTPHFSHTKNK